MPISVLRPYHRSLYFTSDQIFFFTNSIENQKRNPPNRYNFATVNTSSVASNSNMMSDDTSPENPRESDPSTQLDQPNENAHSIRKSFKRLSGLQRDSDRELVNEKDVKKFLQQYKGQSQIVFSDSHSDTTRIARNGDDSQTTKQQKRTDFSKMKAEIKPNTSYTLRYDYQRKKASIPSSTQSHLDKFKKPPFKAIWKPGWCVDNISDRLHKIKAIQRNLTAKSDQTTPKPPQPDQ